MYFKHNAKKMTLSMLGIGNLELERVYKAKTVKIISFVWAKILVGKRCSEFLAHSGM